MRITYLFNRPPGLPLQTRDEAYFYDTAANLFLQMDAAFDRTPNFRNVLGLRKFTPVSKDKPGGEYDDRFWVLWISKDGVKHATEYIGNTEPSYRYFGRDGQNANPIVKGQRDNPNQDNIKDLGRLPIGVYKYGTTRVSRARLGLVFQLTESRRVERDINHDGDFTAEDIKLITNEAAMMEGRTMHFHKGGAVITGSAGCQTLPPEAWQGFVKDIEAGRKAGQTEFTYVLMWRN